MKIMRYLLGLAFGTAGILHFTKERQFRSIVPGIYHYENSSFSDRRI